MNNNNLHSRVRRLEDRTSSDDQTSVALDDSAPEARVRLLRRMWAMVQDDPEQLSSFSPELRALLDQPDDARDEHLLDYVASHRRLLE